MATLDIYIDTGTVESARECSVAGCFRKVYLGAHCKLHHDIEWYLAGGTKRAAPDATDAGAATGQ
jgi:hypothetical protein